ncbi:MAG: hypothetical protein HWE21_05530 [Cytophagia bacterium]|nr:hypothetical protein [Cytophagia bacterium]
MRRDRKSRGFGYFLAEIFILILGISASFVLNEWRVNRQERKQEQELLQNFKANLAMDSLVIHNGLKQLKAQVKNAERLLIANETLEIDSLVVYSVSLLNYVPFNTNDITYQQMKSSGKTGLIQNDSLASQIIGLYENGFERLTSWTLVDSEHVRLKMIPYVEENFPFTLGLNYRLADNAVQREFGRQVKSDQFKHLIQFGMSYKASTAYVFEQVLAEIKEAIDMIDDELSTSQKSSDPESTSQGQ